jgi:glycogen debranching enzyme
MLFATQMQGIPSDLDEFCKSGTEEAFGGLELLDLNVLLHRADAEERDATGKPITSYTYLCRS